MAETETPLPVLGALLVPEDAEARVQMARAIADELRKHPEKQAELLAEIFLVCEETRTLFAGLRASLEELAANPRGILGMMLGAKKESKRKRKAEPEANGELDGI